MTDIVAFLNARLDEDEALARWSGPFRVAWLTYRAGLTQALHGTVATAANDGAWIANGQEVADPETVRIVYDPARVLREVKAKRAIVWQWEQAAQRNRDDECDEAAGSAWATLSNTLVSLAGVYDSHPDYAGDRVENWTWPDDDPAWRADAC